MATSSLSRAHASHTPTPLHMRACLAHAPHSQAGPPSTRTSPLPPQGGGGSHPPLPSPRLLHGPPVLRLAGFASRRFCVSPPRHPQVDDALSVELLDDDSDASGGGGGGVRLWVHIADPTRYVQRGSALEQEARRRGATIYLPTGSIPMFPIDLAAGPLSLRPGVASCALSIGVVLDTEGAIDAAHPPIITPSTVCVRRLTYQQVDAVLDPIAADDAATGSSTGRLCEEPSGLEGGDALDPSASEVTAEEVEVMRRLEWLSEQRLAWRVAGGSMERIAPVGLPDMTIKARRPDAADEEADAAADDSGWSVTVTTGGAAPEGGARRMVTEGMLLAGEAVAAYGADNGVPLAYRSQTVS